MKAFILNLVFCSWTAFFAVSLSQAEDSRLTRLFLVLEKSPTGRILLESARLRNITERIFPDQVSRTDAVITRKYDSKFKREFREREVEIHLNFNQPEIETVLDLAHELTHATAPMSLDPYDPHLTVERYIRNGIEGKGGEADALANECTVSRELMQQGVAVNEARCSRYQDALAANSGEARKIILKDFYRVGYWITPLRSLISYNDFPLLTDRDPILYSSTGRKPYPMALYEEFRQLSKLACENTERRVASLSSRMAKSQVDETSKSLNGFLLARCRMRE